MYSREGYSTEILLIFASSQCSFNHYTRMTKQVLTRLSLLLVVLLGFMACSPNTEYAKVIPSDASMVVSADLASLYKKGDLGSKENKEILERFKQEILSSSNMQDTVTLKKLLEDPSASGLDFEAPIYFFSSFADRPRGGFVIRVGSRSKASELLKKIAPRVEGQVETTEGGLEYLKTLDACIVLNDQSLLAYYMAGDATSEVKTQALEFFSQPEDKQFIKTKKFAEMSKGSSDFSLFFNYDDFLKLYAQFMDSNNELEEQLARSTQETFKDLNLISRVNFEKGKISMATKMYTENAEMLEWLRLADDALQTPKGKFSKHVSKDAFMALTLGVKPSEEYVQKLMNLAVVKILSSELEGVGLDLGAIYRGLSGDLTAYFNTVNPADQSVDFGLYAMLSEGTTLAKNLDALAQYITTKNIENDSLDRVDPQYYEWSDGEVQKYRSRLPELKILGNGEYLLGEGDATWETKISIKDNVLSIIPSKMIGKAQPKEDVTKASFGSELTKYKSYFVINLETILKHPIVGAAVAFLNPTAQAALEELSAIVMYNTSATEAYSELRLKTSKENSLKLIVDMLRDLQ